MKGSLLLDRCAPIRDPASIRKVGYLVPSSNTVLEPLVALLGVLAGGTISHHVGRVSVRRLSLDADSVAQFDAAGMSAAAELLGEAPLDAIAWNGTSGSWLGLEHDQRIAMALAAATGLPATTATLAMYDAYRRGGWRRIAVVCPYTDDVTAQIVAEYERRGLDVVATANLGLTSNVDMGNVAEATLHDALTSVAAARPDCVGVVCTNQSAIQLAPAFEAACGIPVVDSIAATFLATARSCGISVRLHGLGRLLAGE